MHNNVQDALDELELVVKIIRMYSAELREATGTPAQRKVTAMRNTLRHYKDSIDKRMLRCRP